MINYNISYSGMYIYIYGTCVTYENMLNTEYNILHDIKKKKK